MKIKNTFTAPLLVFVIYVLLVLSRFIDQSILMEKGNIYLSLIVLQLLIFALPGFFYCKIKGIESELRLKHISPGSIWFIITCFFVLVLGSTLINTINYYAFGSDGQYSVLGTYSVGTTGSEILDTAYVIVAFVIIPAVMEEFIFRGILLTEYSSYGKFTAIFMSAFMFSMLHFNLKQFLTYFFCGVIMAYAIYVTQSLWSAVLLHVFNNLYSVFFETWLWDVLKKPNSIIFFLFVIITLLTLFLIFSFNSAENILYNYGTKGEKSPPEAYKREGGISLLFQAIASPGFIGCVVFFLVVTLVLN